MSEQAEGNLTACVLPPIEPLESEQIKQIREAANVSQSVFAALLNTSVSTV